MSKLILQMIDDEEKLIKPNKSKKAKNYNGNLVELRKKREKLLLKKHNLNLEIKKYNKLMGYKRDAIFDKIAKLSIEIESINKEIEKIHKGMRHADQWMDGDFNL